MLETAAQTRHRPSKAQAFDVAIAGVATAVPAHKVSQDDIAERAKAVFPHLARLERALCQYRDRESLRLPAEGLVLRAPRLGGAHRSFPTSCASTAGGGDARGGRRCRHHAQGHRRARGQHDHRACYPEPRRQADEPARVPAFGGAPADLRARLRRRRGRAVARGALRARHAGLPRAVPDRRSLQPLPPYRRSEPRDVRFGGVVRRRRGRRRPAQCARRSSRGRRRAAASSPSAIISGRTPSASWAGTSRRTASAWC